MKFYYLHTMELSEAASGDTKLVLESDYNAKIAEKDAEIMRIKAELWIANDRSLRSYDGMAEKADKYDEVKEQLRKTELALEKAKEQLRLANDLISFDINKASDGAAMNHANKLEKYRSNLVKCPNEFEKVFADNFKDILA